MVIFNFQKLLPPQYILKRRLIYINSSLGSDTNQHLTDNRKTIQLQCDPQ